MSPQYGNSCTLTILKADADHPINAHDPIHKKPDPSSALTSSTKSTRFAPSFSSSHSVSQPLSSGFDSSVHVHAVSDHGILLPFLDRPSEVKELLFDTKPNQSLMYRLCSVFGGDPNQPTRRGKDERWDEMLELLTELDRPLLDDEDWLIRLESLVMERSPSLWAQLARCLGAEGLTLHPAIQHGSSRFDSWALPSRYLDADHHNDSPLSPPSDASSDDGHDEQINHSLSVNVEPLHTLPQSYSEQPAAKMQKSSLRESASPAAPSPSSLPEHAVGHASGANTDWASPSEGSVTSAADDACVKTNLLEDIIEEPQSSTHVAPNTPSRRRSTSGKFAGLRISALSSSSPPASRRNSSVSRDASGSPLPTGAMSPAGLAPPSPDAAPLRDTSTCFAKHRRLSTIMVHNNPSQQVQPQALPLDKAPSLQTSPLRRQRGVSEALHIIQGPQAWNPQPRRRTQSFARSFAELTSPTQQLEQLRAEHARSDADRLAEHTRRISLQDSHSTSAASAPAFATGTTDTAGALGLHASADSPDSLDLSARKTSRARAGRKRVGSVDSRGAASSTGSASLLIPGLLPDGRTRHPSGSCGSRDLSESIAAFRKTMGLSVSPSPSERDDSERGDTKSDADKPTELLTRKRKGSGTVELPKPTSRTTNTLEAKISRKGSPPACTTDEHHHAQFQKPKHIQELENRSQASSSSGSGLALGGGFSLAKCGANFRRQSHDATSSQSGWRCSFSRRDATRTRGVEHYSLRSPPAVQRRPGGFVSLAQEYERARQGRCSSEVAFSIHSNAVASSPSSSITSFDVGASHAYRASSDECMPRVETSLAEDKACNQTKAKQATSVDVVKGDPTPKAGPGGGMTPRASFGACSRPEGHPFPKLLNRMTASAADDEGSDEVSVAKRNCSLGPATPLSPLESCRTRLSPSPSATSSSTQSSPRSPSIVFPISPNASISRAAEFRKALDTPACQAAFRRIHATCGASTASSIRELVTTSERSQMHDEHLLEQVAHQIGLVDHQHAQQVGGKQAQDADMVLAEPGYEERWQTFVDLCKSLGVGQYELGLAKRRCGPAIDTCR